MLRPDPLNWFTHEKVADIAPSPLEGVSERYQIPREIDRDSLDPGERALAGFLSVAGSVSAKVVPMIGGAIGRKAGLRGSQEWSGAPVQGQSTIGEAMDAILNRDPSRATKQKNQMMGLFDIEQSHPGGMAAAKSSLKNYGKLQEISDTVDSFIQKHDLPAKGVRMNLQSGPVSGMGGGSYHPSTKEVYLPNVGSEVALHELGHAADYTTRMGKIRSYAEPALQRGVLAALPIALAAGDHIKEMIPGTVDDRAISFMQDHAPGIMAATLTATTLYPEAKASISAIRHIRDLERAGRQPAGATMTAFKRLAPAFGSYLLGVVPAVVGMALARKYMNQARSEKSELLERTREGLGDLEKMSSGLGGLFSGVGRVGDVAKQIAIGTSDLLRQPHTLRRIGHAAKMVGGSPEFIHGALGAAIPATLGALYIYGTPGGSEVRSRLHPETKDQLLKHKALNIGPAAGKNEEWRGAHPFRFAGLVAMGAALSGGIMSRFIHDLTRVL